MPFRAVCTIYFGHKISIQHFGIFWDRLGNGAEIVSPQTDGLMRTKGNGAPGCCLWVLLENAIRGSTRMVCVYVCVFFLGADEVRVGPSLSFSTVGNKPHQGKSAACCVSICCCRFWHLLPRL